jgi:integrase
MECAMGSVRKDVRGSGWQARYRDRSGRQRTKILPSKADANRFLHAVETEVVRGTWTDPSLARMRFGVYAARWRESLSHVRPGTLSNIDSRLRRHIIPAFGDWPIGNIEPSDVRDFVADQVALGLSPGTVAGTYHLLARILSTAEIDCLIPRTPCKGIELPRNGRHQEMHFLGPAEVATLAETIEPRYRVLIYTAAYTGLRWGELAGLHVERCNLLRGSINVIEALTEVNGHVEVGPTKTGKTRAVSIPRFLRDLLGEHLAMYGSPGGFVFTSAEGTPLRRTFYRRHYKPAVRRAGLPEDLRFHDLRHTCAALLIAQGAHPKEIQERLGHSTIRLTFDRYGHLLPSLDDRLREGLDRLWEEATHPVGALVSLPLSSEAP